MSRSSRREEKAQLAGPDGATPDGPMTLTGLVKMRKPGAKMPHYATAVVVLSETGEVVSVSLNHSQSQKEHANREHYRQQAAQAMKV